MIRYGYFPTMQTPTIINQFVGHIGILSFGLLTGIIYSKKIPNRHSPANYALFANKNHVGIIPAKRADEAVNLTRPK